MYAMNSYVANYKIGEQDESNVFYAYHALWLNMQWVSPCITHPMHAFIGL